MFFSLKSKPYVQCFDNDAVCLLKAFDCNDMRLKYLFIVFFQLLCISYLYIGHSNNLSSWCAWITNKLKQHTLFRTRINLSKDDERKFTQY